MIIYQHGIKAFCQRDNLKSFQESKADTVPFAPMGGGKLKSTFAQDFPRSDPKQFGIDNFLRSGRSEGYHQKSIRIKRKQQTKRK